MMRAYQKSPLSPRPLGALFLLVFLLTGAKSIVPGDILQQEGVLYRTEGLQLQKVGDLDRAAAAFRQAVSVKPDYAEAYNDLGVVLESLGDLDGAEEAYKTALKFKPDLGPAHSNLALLYEESERLKQAAAHWGARVRLGPLKDPWVAVAREKLAKYQLPVPETDEDKAQKKGKEIRLLRPVGTRAAQTEGRQIRELETVKDRVAKEAANARREEAVREVELERDRTPVKQLESARAVRQLKGLEAAKRVEAESRAEKIKARAAADRKFKESEKARQTRPPVVPVVKPADKVKVQPRLSTAPLDAQALAREIVKEKSKARGKASDDLVRRAAVAMREGLYQDAVEIYKQILILEPGNRSAQQGLERARKAFAKVVQ